MRKNDKSAPMPREDGATPSDDVFADAPGWNFPVPDGVPGLVTWEWDVLSATARYSNEWLGILQESDPAFAGPATTKWWARVHEDDILPFLDVAKSITEGRTEVFRALIRVRRADGRWAWLLSQGRVTSKEDGRPAMVHGALIDVSELRSDVKFQHGSVLFEAGDGQAAPEDAPDLVVRLGEDLFPLFSNPKIADIMTGKGVFPPAPRQTDEAGIAPELSTFLRRNVRRVLAEGRAVREQISFATAYGHDVTGEYSFWPEFDAQGKVEAVKTRFLDLTERVQAERRAHLNEMRLEALYRLTQMDNATEDEILRFVLDSVIKLTGSEAGFLFFPQGDLCAEGRMIWSIRHHQLADECPLPNNRLHPAVAAHVADESGRCSRVIRNGNGLHPVIEGLGGRMRIMRYITMPVNDSGRTVCLAGVCNKVTDYTGADLQQVEIFITSAWHILRRHDFVRELQRAKDTAERAKEAAEHANRVKDAFLANVSHELRTPLNGIISMLQLLALLPLNEQQREYARTADASGRTLMRIISDILDFAHMGSGKMPLHNEVFNLPAALEAPLDMFRSQAKDKGLKFHARIDKSIPVALMGDEARIRQLVFNVAGNAIKFTEQGEINVECLLLPPADDGRTRIGFRVSDTGIGIPPHLRQSVFEAFTQADSSPTRRHSGTGLGLSIVKALVTLMDGDVSLESEPGKGTTVSWTLCLDPPPESVAEAPVLPGEGPAAAPRGLDILVAEDDAVSRFAMHSFLGKAGHRAVCVPDGRQALEALMLHRFDCLFTDIQMPGMDGLELVQRIREGRLDSIFPGPDVRTLLRENLPGPGPDAEPPVVEEPPRDIVTVAVSAHAMTGDKERFLAQGMDFYISKPVIMQELLRVLDGVSRQLADKKDAPPGRR